MVIKALFNPTKHILTQTSVLLLLLGFLYWAVAERRERQQGKHLIIRLSPVSIYFLVNDSMMNTPWELGAFGGERILRLVHSWGTDVGYCRILQAFPYAHFPTWDIQFWQTSSTPSQLNSYHKWSTTWPLIAEITSLDSWASSVKP